ncbi:hypothetical protein HWV62_32820 [Athelia sp. TMB]|nr:hypothetical protein HWV62_32820 [Athelia sp. TMB]
MLLLATMLPNANAAPTTPNRSVLTSNNDCGDSSFVGETSGGSPLISDCQIIQKNIAGGGTWTTSAGAQRQLVQFGTCAFGITVISDGAAIVGNQDIIDLINSSIQLFGSGRRVAAKGAMPCNALFGGPRLTVDWELRTN